MRALAILLPALVSACSNVQVNYASATAAQGATVFTTSGGSVQAQGTMSLLLLGAAVLATAADPGTSNYKSSFMTVTDPNGYRIAPEMLVDRLVAEQDCTKPIEDWSANLKCR